MPDILISIIGIVTVLLAGDLVLTAADHSLSTINRARLLTQHQEKTQKVDQLISLLDDRIRLGLTQAALRFLKKIVLIITVGIALASLAWTIGISTAVLFQQSRIFILIGILIVLALIFTWTESLVITLVHYQPEKWAINFSSMMAVLGVLFMPILKLRYLIMKDDDAYVEPGSLVTEDELKSMVDASQQGGLLEQDERKMIYSIFDLGDTLVREIMVPRIDVLAIDVNDDPSQSVDKLLNSGYSRVPVFEENVDNILGLLYVKDLMKAWLRLGMLNSLRDLLRPAYFVPEAKKVDELLAEMQAQRIHMAIAVDEYGGVAGLVTLEDIVEEIVGEIRDEFDDGEEAFYEETEPGIYICSGRMDVDDVNELMGTNLPKEEADTLAGLIYSEIGHVPVEDESIVVNGLRLTVKLVYKRRIRQVRVEKVEELADIQPIDTQISGEKDDL